jgi:hypothetical protein
MMQQGAVLVHLFLFSVLLKTFDRGSAKRKRNEKTALLDSLKMRFDRPEALASAGRATDEI